MGLLGAIASFFTALLESSVARFIATKIILTTLFITILPLVLKKIVFWLMNNIMTLINSILPTDIQAISLQLTGLAAYLGNLLQVPLIISILLSAIALKFTLNIIKIIK